MSGEKASTLTTANLKAFVSKARKKEKEGSSTNVAKEGGGSVGQEIPLKRKRGGGNSRVVDLTAVKDDNAVFTAEEIDVAFQSQVGLHGYKEGPSNSIWSAGFPFMAVADEFAQVDSDVKTIHEAGKIGVARYLQVIGARLLSIGRTSELDAILDADNVVAVKKLKESLQERDLKIDKLRSEVKALKKASETEVNKLKKDLDVSVAETGGLKARIAELEEEVLTAFTFGFDRAVAQIGVVAPEVDINLLDVTKIVSGGRLMDDGTLPENQDESVSVEKGAD
ncbi:hypothetical protein Ahy_B01g052861 isoform B [Arachis hypogaea]|uniref:Uncharacterized protein n=1 Tax=Arachis hypogaea TaxID=3818 RepID=A0A445AQM1_ARAHY|nr:hypothetical protein Ahy_B01g052861 isoform B [Arachis hypogaea]